MFLFTKLDPPQIPQEPAQYYPNTTTLYFEVQKAFQAELSNRV